MERETRIELATLYIRSLDISLTETSQVCIQVLPADSVRFCGCTFLLHSAYKTGKRPTVCAHCERRFTFHFAPENVGAGKVSKSSRFHATHERSASEESQAHEEVIPDTKEIF